MSRLARFLFILAVPLLAIGEAHAECTTIAVTDRGATPRTDADDLSFDDDAFAKAVADADAASCGIVSVSPGIYDLQNAVSLTNVDHVAIRGTAGAIIQLCVNGFVGGAVDNVEISALELRGGQVPIFLAPATNMVVADNVITGASSDGIRLNKVTGASLLRNTILSVGGRGISSISGGGSELRIEGNVVDDVHEEGIGLWNTTDCAIADNEVRNVIGGADNNGYGILVYGTADNKNLRNSVTGNVVEHTDGSGIYVQFGYNCVVENNTITDAARVQDDKTLVVGSIAVNGFVDGPPQNNVVNGNTASGSGKAGIALMGWGWIARGNTISGAAGSGIHMRGGGDAQLLDNTVNDSFYGIRATTAPMSGIVIRGNNVARITSHGMELITATDAEVTGNTLANLGDYGIRVLGAGHSLVANSITAATSWGIYIASEATRVSDNHLYNDPQGVIGQSDDAEQSGTNTIVDNVFH